MRLIFKAEMKRTFNWGFLIGILGVAFSICFDSWNDLVRSIENHNGEVYYYFFNSAYGGLCRAYILPIFAALPFATSFCKERKSKALGFIVSREGKKQYCITKYIVNAISGGLVVAAGTLLLILFLKILFPMGGTDYQDAPMSDLFHSWTVIHRPLEYVFVQMILGFLRGIIWASVALVVSVFISDPLVVTISPYLFSYTFVQFLKVLKVPNNCRLDLVLIGREVIKTSRITVAVAIMITGLIVAVIGGIFVRKVYKGLRDGNIY